MVNFDLRLGDTYWSKGFFNVSVDFQRYLTMTDGAIQIFLGDSDTPLVGRISRSANRNGTPRIFGNKPLADFFQKNFKKGGSVPVAIISLQAIRIGGELKGPQAIVSLVATPLGARSHNPPQLVSADQLGTWRRALIGILNKVDPRVSRGPDEGLGKRIQRLSYDGVIPREVAAMMRVVTEMRNMTEYQAKVLSASESAAVISAWSAIRQWADTVGSKK